MKSSSGKLKNLDYKQLLIDHGEKAAMGLVGLFVLLALMTSRWSKFETHPQEIIQKATSAKEQIHEGTWPEDEQQQYPVKAGLDRKVAQIYEPIDITRYSYRGYGLSFALHVREEPVRTPERQKVEQLLAAADRAVLLMPTATSFMPGGEAGEWDSEGRQPIPGENEKKSDGKVPEGIEKFQINRRRGAGGAAGMPMGPGYPGDGPAMPGDYRPGLPGGYGPMGPRGPAGAGLGPSAGHAGAGAGLLPGNAGMMPGDASYESDGYGMAGYGGMAGSGYEADGRRFASVRGVFNLYRQREAYAKALNLTDDAVLRRNLIRFHDFKLQRQTRGPDGSWSDWEVVSIETAMELLRKVEIDEDVVQTGVTDHVITMYLPRQVWFWGRIASHPALAKYELTQEAREQQRLINEALAELQKKREDLEADVIRPGGFAGLQTNLSGFRRDMMYDQEMQTSFTNTLTQYYDDMDMDADESGSYANYAKRTVEEAKVTAVGNLVLFRYLDFAVEPGETYRYRVKLVLVNPVQLLRLEPEQLAPGHQHLHSAVTLETDWSDPTEPVSVPPDYQVFLTEVDRPGGRLLAAPQAELELFQWFPKPGTTAKAKLKLSAGDFIGGSVDNTYVLDPARPSLEKQKQEFQTGAMLVDLADGGAVESDLLSDLKVQGVRGKAGLVEEVLVVEEDGELKKLDPISLSSARQYADQVLDAQMKPFEPYRDLSQRVQPQMGEGDGSYLSIEGYESDYPGASPAKKKKKSRRSRTNPYKKAGAGYPAMGYPGGMPPGGGYPGGGFPGGMPPGGGPAGGHGAP